MSISRVAGRLAALVLLGITLAGCGINKIPAQDEQVKAAWSQVQNEYQRRADLVPNLVATVKGYAKQEQTVLTAVIEARAKATQTVINADQLANNPEALKKFEASQATLGGALSRLMAVTEAYPDLKSNSNFLALQAQLEGTENRITVARRDYIQAVQGYNTMLRTIPYRWTAAMFYPDAKPYPSFTTSEKNQSAPTVQF
ncbi:MAG: LemA family protein [Alphaproteobacteria bacterium]|nr:LemA family protein [Alphaproteobacteria bacterium]